MTYEPSHREEQWRRKHSRQAWTDRRRPPNDQR